MRWDVSAIFVVGVSALLLGQASPVQAQVVSFLAVRDAVPMKFFDSATTSPSPANPNDLRIGFNSGFDPTTFTTNDFKASAASFSNRFASDTIAVWVIAPEGFYVSKLTYTQKGSASTQRTAVQRGSTQWVILGFPANVGDFSSTPDLTSTVNLTGLFLRVVPVSVTVSLFAGPGGSVAITDAHVVAELAPLPLP